MSERRECPHGCGPMARPVEGDPLEDIGSFCPDCGYILYTPRDEMPSTLNGQLREFRRMCADLRDAFLDAIGIPPSAVYPRRRLDAGIPCQHCGDEMLQTGTWVEVELVLRTAHPDGYRVDCPTCGRTNAFDGFGRGDR